ncbi:MAG: phosphopentomutase [Clostridiales bacterium]|nr:phosphopentomutase [Clostridiales bacterium]
MNYKRIFLIVMDSLGCGALPDANLFGDEGSNTLKSCYESEYFNAPNLKKLGIFNIDNINCGEPEKHPIGTYAKLQELSVGKDTTTGHWEFAGLVSTAQMPTYPNGFPLDLMQKLEHAWGRGWLVNKPYSGTEVLLDYGKQHEQTGKLIVYTSADSVFQIAAHENIVPIEKLYEYCKIARQYLNGDHAVGRVIARPFVGTYPNYTRTANRHDYSLLPPSKTMLNYLQENNKKVISVGKIYDIFAGSGIDESYRTVSNQDGMEKTINLLDKDFEGLCFVNLVDFDAKFGHRNDIDGYAKAITEFDEQLGRFMQKMNKDDLLIITADHGCDPKTPSTDHSREYVPMLCYASNIKADNNLGTIKCFGAIAKTILQNFNINEQVLKGESFLNKIICR